MEETKKLSCIDCNVKKCNVKQNIENHKPYPGFCVSHKIGIASCVGLLKESHLLAGLLREYGFEVYGVGCKIGEVPKTEVGIPERCEEVGVHMCNPILQAQMLNKEKTDINIVMGLCVGHDSLFYKYAEAPSTTLVVKDRVLGNNPVAALYTLDSYYKKLHHLNLEEE